MKGLGTGLDRPAVGLSGGSFLLSAVLALLGTAGPAPLDVPCPARPCRLARARDQRGYRLLGGQRLARQRGRALPTLLCSVSGLSEIASHSVPIARSTWRCARRTSDMAPRPVRASPNRLMRRENVCHDRRHGHGNALGYAPGRPTGQAPGH